MKLSTVQAGYRIILNLIKPYKRKAILLIFVGIIAAVGNAAIPYLSGQIVDALLHPASSVWVFNHLLPTYVVFIVLWFLVQAIANVTDWQMRIVGELVGGSIRYDYLLQSFQKLFKLPISFHKDHKVGDLGNKISMTASKIEAIIQNITLEIGSLLLSLTVAFVVTFLIQPLLATILVGAILLYIFTLSFKVRSLSDSEREIYKLRNEAYGDAFDALGNIKLIKTVGAEETMSNRLNHKFKEVVLPLWVKIFGIWEEMTFLQRIIVTLTQLTLFGVGAHFVVKGEMSIGELVAFNGYAALVFGPFVRLGQFWQDFQTGLVDIEELEAHLSLPSERYYEEDGIEFDTVKGRIEFQNVSFAYSDGREILKGINFEARPGEVIALVGESGVGKTTLIDLISGYHYPTSGKVLIDGHDLKDVNLSSLRKRIALVPQDISLLNDTIAANIAFARPDATRKEIVEAAMKAHANTFIEKFADGYDQLVGERGVKLSTGQRQRIAIAQAILRNPSILVLDEPTSALDSVTEREIAQVLSKVMEGKTTFIIAHRLSTVRHADQILVVKDGQIKEKGTHDELLRIEGGEYRHLYNLQIGLHE